MATKQSEVLPFIQDGKIGYAKIPKNKSGFIIGLNEFGNEVSQIP